MERKGKTLSLATLLLAAAFAGASAQKENGIETGTTAKAEAARPSGTLPVMHIDTENGAPVNSKTVYVAATFYIAPTAADPAAGLGTPDAPLPLQIRGRGHSSWKGEKKPYKLKLGSAAPLLGMGRNKHWALLKPIESAVAGLRLAELTGMAWTPHYRPVEVVLNGDYAGLYFLTETIRIDENRVDIFRQSDLETDPARVGGGWLVEVDNYHDECQITLPECSSWNLTLRYHSPERLSAVQRVWLTDEFAAINAAIYSPDATSAEWERFVDARSMARFFILQEVMDNPDGFHGSFYLHKDLGDGARWVAGPAWDLACYNREKTDYTFRMKVHYGFTPHWIGQLILRDGFCRAVREVWDEIYPGLEDALLDDIDAAMLPLADAWQCDAQRWGSDPTQTAQVRAERIKHALQRNIEWFAAHLPASPYASVSSPAAPVSGRVRVHALSGLYLGEYATEAEAAACLRGGIYLFNGKKVAVK